MKLASFYLTRRFISVFRRARHWFLSYLLKIHSSIILPSTSGSSAWFFPSGFSMKNFVCVFHPSHACSMPRPSHTPWFYHSDNIWWSVQVMKLLIMQSSPFSHPFLPLRSKYSSQHPVFKQPQSMLCLCVRGKELYIYIYIYIGFIRIHSFRNAIHYVYT
jgi:hypothetical protein